MKKAIFDSDYTIEKFWPLMGYSTRSGLNYQLRQDRLDSEIKEKAASILGKTVDEIFEQNNDQKDLYRRENIALTRLADAQEKIIGDRKQIDDIASLIMQKLINNEAYSQVLVRRIADVIHLLSEGKVDKKTVEDQSKKEVKAIFEGLSSQLTEKK